MKKLTKAEIKFIDNYLIKNGVKFWDVRLELLDHIVSAVEDKMANDGVSFNEALLEVHRGFGNQFIEFGTPKKEIFTKGLYQSNIGFEKFIRNKQKELGRQQRKIYRRTFIKFLTSSRFLLEFILIIVLVSAIYSYNQKTAFVVTMLLSMSTEILKLSKSAFSKSIRKSLRAQIASSLGALWMSLNYFFVMFFNETVKEEIKNPYFYGIIFYIIIFIFLRHSYNIYSVIIEKNNEEYNALIS